VRNILGQTVEFNALESIIQNARLTTKIIDNQDLFESFRFFDHEFKAKAGEQTKKVREFMEERIGNLLERYALYASEIKERIESLRIANRDLRADDFRGLLPSREEFWEELSHCGLLDKEKEYVVVDKKKADSIVLDKNYYENKICAIKQLACKEFPKFVTKLTYLNLYLFARFRSTLNTLLAVSILLSRVHRV
jgi:hypothetical protein